MVEGVRDAVVGDVADDGAGGAAVAELEGAGREMVMLPVKVLSAERMR